jgi:hypothetical protein
MLLLVLSGCSTRLTSEKAQETLNKWMSRYPGKVEVQGMYFGPEHLAYVKLKFDNFVYRAEPRGDLKYFSGEGTALFAKENENWVLSTVWADKEQIPVTPNLSVADNNGASNSNHKIVEEPVNDDIKVLAQESYSPVSAPFIVIARDAATYAALRELVSNLPEVGADYFKSNTIVAAFQGTCQTGGFSVQLKRVGHNTLKADDEILSVREIVDQGLTQPTRPYQVVSVPLGENEEININDNMNIGIGRAVLLFEVSSGEFETVNDAGQPEKFQFGGLVNVDRYGKLVTLKYSLVESGGQQRKLNGRATGIIQPDEKIIIAPIGAGTFIKQPYSLLRITGKIPKGYGATALIDGSNLVLSLESLSSKTVGSFGGKGKLEAKKAKPL